MLFFKKAYESIDVKSIDELNETKIIDVRSKQEFSQNHIKKAVNIEMNQLLQTPEKYLKETETYYIVCQSGMRSKLTCANLVKKGYHVINLKGGMNRY